MIQSAVFLDRDGVLNEMPLNPLTGEYESPHSMNDLKILPEVLPALHDLQKQFKLFVVSNQPSYAKGKTSLEALDQIKEKFAHELKSNKIKIEEYYYCHHHPQGTIPEFSIKCECRKPSPYFLKKASHDYKIDLKSSWMLGDRDTDIECGQKAGTKTILIEYPFSKKYQRKANPTLKAENIFQAAILILSKQGAHR